jgi:hypothetical protein
MEIKVLTPRGIEIYNSDSTPMSICLSEFEKREIASVVGMPDMDIYNRFPAMMSVDEFDNLMNS